MKFFDNFSTGAWVHGCAKSVRKFVQKPSACFVGSIEGEGTLKDKGGFHMQPFICNHIADCLFISFCNACLCTAPVSACLSSLSLSTRDGPPVLVVYCNLLLACLCLHDHACLDRNVLVSLTCCLVSTLLNGPSRFYTQ